MTSFIDLMANDVWTEVDITRRTEAMIRTEFSAEAETILNRKVLGISLGTYQPTPEDQAEMQRYAHVAFVAQQANTAARADMALLRKVFPLEAAQFRLDMPLPGEDASPEDVARDATERADAQAVIDAADADALELFERRKAARA